MYTVTRSLYATYLVHEEKKNSLWIWIGILYIQINLCEFSKLWSIYCKRGNIRGALIFREFRAKFSKRELKNPQKYLRYFVCTCTCIQTLLHAVQCVSRVSTVRNEQPYSFKIYTMSSKLTILSWVYLRSNYSSNTFETVADLGNVFTFFCNFCQQFIVMPIGRTRKTKETIECTGAVRSEVYFCEENWLVFGLILAHCAAVQGSAVWMRIVCSAMRI